MTSAQDDPQAPLAPQSQWEPKRQNLFAQILALRELPTIIAILALSAFIAWRNPTFLSTYNMQLLAKEVGVLGILGIGEMVVIITKGIDLSVGSIVAMISVLVAAGLAKGFSIPVVVLAAITVCILIGLMHSFFINKIGLAPFIITLGSLSIWRGVTLVLTRGYPIKITNKDFLALGQGDIMGIPMQFVFLVLVTVVYTIMLRNTPLGRYMLRDRAQCDGRPPGGCCGAGGAHLRIRAGDRLVRVWRHDLRRRLGQGMPGIAFGLELPVIAAAVIGGTSMTGGVGRPIGTIIGAILISLILNAMNMLAISSYWQELASGLVIVFAVLIDILNQRRLGVK